MTNNCPVSLKKALSITRLSGRIIYHLLHNQWATGKIWGNSGQSHLCEVPAWDADSTYGTLAASAFVIMINLKFKCLWYLPSTLIPILFIWERHWFHIFIHLQITGHPACSVSATDPVCRNLWYKCETFTLFSYQQFGKLSVNSAKMVLYSPL